MALLEVNGLVKIYGRRRVVDGVSFDVSPGEVVGLLGPNGAGKTTSFRMTTGQIVPNDGEVIFNGADVTELPMYLRARQGMGYLSQEQSVFKKLSVEQNILAILEALPRSRSLKRRLTKQERIDRTNDVLARFNLTHVRKNIAARCSGGEKRRLEIARCLVCEPMLILLDEPFAAVDPKTTEDIRSNIRELAQQGIGILLTDHNVREVLKITDRSYLIKDGKVVTRGTPRELIRDPIAINEYLGNTFNDDGFGNPILHTAPSQAAPSILPMQSAPAPMVHSPIINPTVHAVLEQDRIVRLIDTLKHPEQGRAAEVELIGLGAVTIPYLLDAMERRDMDMRQRAYRVLQHVAGANIPFDPYSPDELRRRQIASLRERWERRAG